MYVHVLYMPIFRNLILVPFSELSDETTEVKFEVFDKEKPPGSKNRELKTA